MLSMMPVSPMTEPVYATGGFAGGDGSAGSPYQIATAGQLAEVQNYLDSHFILNNDIDLGGITNWEPIGSFNTSLTSNIYRHF